MNQEPIFDSDQFAEALLNRDALKPWRSRMLESEWSTLSRHLRKRLLDFFCILRYGKRYEQLMRSGDDGIFKLADVLSNPLRHSAIRERHQRAVNQNDKEFLRRFSRSIGERSRFDPRKDKLFELRMYIFLNWDVPLLNPALITGFRFRSNEQILEWLSKVQEDIESPIFWEPGRLTKELTKLKLNRKNPPQPFQTITKLPNS